MSKQVSTRVKPYGSCLYKSPDSGKVYLFVTSKSGIVEQYELFSNKSNKVGARLVRSIKHNEGKDFV
jgi:3-phytase